ncbi:hypothetical protein QYE77_14520 [Thermanaerothrix sp. 4228-RoL]|uniref:Uncharacterized protein n=1 Tax=Thermanaerothrix solaris TaxID=3058434 RepID=A0ABU3NRM4_9CHLR|nr:hypothetical protein [Thermanaerothrix sp. 4228-RoL]MDT8899476.1 hypothetical protein [Thermanaerothrix sp. 4228-RoL]
MFRLEKPDELKQVDDLDLVRMTRYEVLDRYGVLPMHYRAQVIREQVLTPEVLKDMIAKVLAMPEGVKRGRLVWEALLPLVPLQPHGLDRFDVQNAAMETLRREEQRFEFESSAWWWRLRVVHGIEDPTAWVVEQRTNRAKGWARRVLAMAFGDAGLSLMRAYQLAAKCEQALARRKGWLVKTD